MKKTLLTAVMLTTLIFAGNQEFEANKAKCIDLLKTTITCIEKATNHKEGKACKDEMKVQMKILKDKMGMKDGKCEGK